MYRFFSRSICCFLLISSWTIFSFAQTEKTIRYAILTSESVTEDGLNDLLTAKLTDVVDDIQLIERDEINKVMREIQLSTLSQTHGIGNRIELGKILAADRLLVLQKNKTENSELTFQIIDTFTGSILFNGAFEKYQESMVETVDALAKMVDTNAKNFEDGIHAIIAVPPFLSKGVDSKSESYQRSFSQILQASLMRQPGLAVVSFDEYEAIRRELDFSGKQLSRVMPLLVRGEFFARHQSNADSPSEGDYLFDMTLHISDKNGIQNEIVKQLLTQQQVAEFLAVEVAEQIFSNLNNENFTPFSLEEQKKAFAEMADRFHAYGMYSQARSYQESILLIDPMDVYARCAILENLWLVNKKYRISPVAKDAFEHVDFLIRNKQLTIWQAICLCRFSLYSDYLSEYDWQNHPLLKNLAKEDLIYYDSHIGIIHFAPMIFQLPATIDRAVPENAIILNSGKNEKYYSENEWIRIVLENHVYPLFWTCCNEEHMESIYDDYLKLVLSVPENCYYIPASNNMYRIYQGTGPNWCLDAKNRNSQKWQYVKTKMLETGRNDLAFLVNYFDVMETMDRDCVATEKTPEAIQKMIDFATERKIVTQAPWMQQFLETYQKGYEAQRANLAQEKLAFEETQKTSVRSDYLCKMPFQLPVEENFHLEMKMVAEPVENWGEAFGYRFGYVTKSKLSDQRNWARNESEILIPVPHNSKADLAWNRWSVYFWRKVTDGIEQKQFYRYDIPEKYTNFKSQDEIFVNNIRYGDGNGIIRVRSDGKNIWVATTEGILCFNGTGKMLGRFDTTTGLPEFVTASSDMGNKNIRYLTSDLHDGFWHEIISSVRECQFREKKNGPYHSEYVILSVFPVGNNEAIAYGRSGANLKTWIAKLSFDTKSNPQVKVLHVASRDLPSKEKKNPEIANIPQNINTAFDIHWVSEMKDPLFPERRQVLMSRSFAEMSLNADETLPPLLIDLDTDEVMLVTQRYPDLNGLGGFENVKCVNGHLIGIDERAVYSFDRNEENQFVKTDLGLRRRGETSAAFQPQRNWLIVDGNNVYSTGKAWYRIDCSAEHGKPNIEKIADEIVPYEGFFESYTKTASFGICGIYLCNPFHTCCHRCGELYRFDFSKSTNKDFTHSERYVTEIRRAEHDRVNQLLTEKGALIAGSMSDWLKKHEENSPYVMLEGDRHTMVVLDRNWKGTSADLEKIDNLFRPWTIYFYDLELTDDDVKTLTMLLTKSRIRYIYFINAGLSKEQLKLLDCSLIEMLGLYYDDPSKKPDDEWATIIYEPEKHGLARNPFKGYLRYNDGIFSPETQKYLEKRKK